MRGLLRLAGAEEWLSRGGTETWSGAPTARRSVLFGLVHSLVGIPIGVALALSVGGFYFTWAYLRVWRRTGSEEAALGEGTRSHLAYNPGIPTLVIFAPATRATQGLPPPALNSDKAD